MMRSLVTRLTVLEQVTIVVAVIAFGFTSLLITEHTLRREERAFVTATAQRLAMGLDEELHEQRDTLVAAREAVANGLEARVHVEVRDPDGRVLASSRPALPAAARPGSDAATSSPEPMFVANATSRLGVQVTVWAPEAPRRKTVRALIASLALAALPILLLSLLFGRSIVAVALRPLSLMAARASSLSIEHKPRTLGSRSGLEEVDRLAESFDRVLERLDDALSAERRLTADASHELRTPLTVLSGELEMLLEQAPPGSEAAAGLKRAAAQTGAMSELVEAILLLHRSSETVPASDGASEILNLCDLARESLAETLLRYPDRSKDTRLDAPDEILVKGRGALLASALRNLIDNALKFTRPGDKVELRVAEAESEAVFTVDDQGPGVRAEERERVFDPFFRGVEAASGVSGFGLGLPILRRVARAHGGDAQVQPSRLGGACFALRLPRLGAGAAQ